MISLIPLGLFFCFFDFVSFAVGWGGFLFADGIIIILCGSSLSFAASVLGFRHHGLETQLMGLERRKKR